MKSHKKSPVSPGFINWEHTVPLLHTPQPKPDDPHEEAREPAVLPIEELNADMSFWTFFSPHCGHSNLLVSTLEENTNSSKTWLHLLHLNSKIGMRSILLHLIHYQLRF